MLNKFRVVCELLAHLIKLFKRHRKLSLILARFYCFFLTFRFIFYNAIQFAINFDKRKRSFENCGVQEGREVFKVLRL